MNYKDKLILIDVFLCALSLVLLMSLHNITSNTWESLSKINYTMANCSECYFFGFKTNIFFVYDLTLFILIGIYLFILISLVIILK